MNLSKLIEAAHEIDRLALAQKARAEAWSQLAHDARSSSHSRVEIDRRRRELDASVVVDFSSAIEQLQEALHSK